ncbi:hypothetical protein G5714_021850 [Onychostoma macrolepis]|uniref:Uncharacterized protein n=1 Tax=Onychostoma macrolepis TaxID=369639 RepID=A0A7J6BW12_9TELE|nr:hypothetical protein G5714_021850 [Onychostoma macrolepis]
MEFITSSGIKVPNAVMVSGLLESPEDEEIIDFLRKYGSTRLVPVTDTNSEFYKNLIVEYQDAVAIEALAPLLPYSHELKDHPDGKYYVQALASVYTTKVGCSVTKAYLDEIKKLAKLSGRGSREEQPKPLERRKTRQNIRSDPREVDQSSDEDDIIPVTWSQGEPVQEVTRYIVSRDVPRHHGPSHSKENLMTDLNKVTDDVPDNVSSLPDVTPVNRVTLDLNLPGNEPVERETNLPDSDDLVEGSDEDCPEQLPVPSDMPECDETNVYENEGEEEIKETEEQAHTDDLVRRSERNRQPPRRLDYTELGTPLVTVVKSLFQGLTTVWNDIISESDASTHSPVLSPPVITV